MPSPLAGHAVNPSMGARWRHPCRHTVPQSARTPRQTVGWWFYRRAKATAWPPARRLSYPCAPTNSTGPCPPTVAGPLAAWMPPRSYMDVLAACPAMVGGQGPATKPQMISSAPDLSGSSNQIATPASRVSRSFGDLQAGRARGALTARGTRRESVRGGSVAASMPPHGPAIGEDTTPDSWLVVLSKSKGHRIASLLVACHIHAHRPSPLVLARPPSRDPWRHGCRHGATWMYLQRVLRWWAGKGPAAKAQIISSAPDLSIVSDQVETPALCRIEITWLFKSGQEPLQQERRSSALRLTFPY
ncbi:hypothetical protein FHR55_003178 [Xanthomonas arboricola]